MRIIYILPIDRNNKGAAFNRVDLLSKGIKEHGIDVELLLYRSAPILNRFFIRLWVLKNLLSLFIRICFLQKSDIVILYGEDHYWRYILKIPRRCKILLERNEYSTYLIRENLSQRNIDSIKSFEKSLQYVDGMIVCSSFLKEYYSQFTNSPIIIIPLVIDINEFKVLNSEPEKYIAYCGDFGGNKDGLPILLEAFACISSKYPDYQLYLIGDTSEDMTMEYLKSRVKELNLNSRVVFTGRVSHNKMPYLLNKASLLVLARPANKQAEGGIPSKLAEYLATGRPTLVTKVGELQKYLTDSIDIFFAQPDSSIDFAKKMDMILSNYEQAREVGFNGARSVLQFDYYKQSEFLIKSIKQCLKIKYS